MKVLTKEEKEHIRAEEIFRAEVQRELRENENKKGTSLLSRLNTSLGIWFLSTVVAGGFTFWYNYSREQQALNNIKARIDREIATRLRNFNIIQRDTTLAVAMQILENPSRSVFPAGVYPEYRERGLGSLLSELSELDPEDDSVALARDKIAFFAEYYNHVSGPVIGNGGIRLEDGKVLRPLNLATLGAKLEVESICKTHLNLLRWEKPFSYQPMTSKEFAAKFLNGVPVMESKK